MLSMSFANIPHLSSIAGVRLASRLTTASRRTRRGLDTSLTPGSFLRHVGNVQVWPYQDLNAQDQDRDRRGHGRGRHGESFLAPVHASEWMNAALRSAA